MISAVKWGLTWAKLAVRFHEAFSEAIQLTEETWQFVRLMFWQCGHTSQLVFFRCFFFFTVIPACGIYNCPCTQVFRVQDIAEHLTTIHLSRCERGKRCLYEGSTPPGGFPNSWVSYLFSILNLHAYSSSWPRIIWSCPFYFNISSHLGIILLCNDLLCWFHLKINLLTEWCSILYIWSVHSQEWWNTHLGQGFWRQWKPGRLPTFWLAVPVKKERNIILMHCPLMLRFGEPRLALTSLSLPPSPIMMTCSHL